jgi:hypothetical protein
MREVAEMWIVFLVFMMIAICYILAQKSDPNWCLIYSVTAGAYLLSIVGIAVVTLLFLCEMKRYFG